MDMLKKYQACEKLMPWNIKNLALNLHPEITFQDGKLIYSKEYFSKGEIKNKYIALDLKTFEEKTKKIKEEKKVIEEYHLEYSKKVFSSKKKYSVYIKDYNLYLNDELNNKEYQITIDGNEFNSYSDIIYSRVYATKYLKNNKGTDALFSKDDSKVLVTITKKSGIKKLSVTQTFNNDSFDPLHPITYEYDDWFPFEDVKISYQLAILDIKTKKLEILNEKPLDGSVYVSFQVKWDEDSNGFVYMDSKYREKVLYHVNVSTKEFEILGKETCVTFFFDESIQESKYSSYPGPYYITKDKKVIWLTQKDDQGSIYFIDKNTKELGKKITSLDYNVASLINVDEEKETIYFMAQGLSCFSEPYYGALCSIKFDGTNFKQYTFNDTFHEVTIDPTFTYFTDIESRSDLAPKTYLRTLDLSFEKIIVESDITKLLKAGYQIPKRFKVHSKETGYDIYGIIVLPKNYNPNKKYPVIDYVYGGMQIVNTPKTFTIVGSIPGRECFGGLEGFQALGFIGVVIDGLGTPFRGKKFHDYSYQNMGKCSGLYQHPEVIKELAKEYSGIDLDRVGIWGNSAGGYATVRALCMFNDFYKVGVSSAGDHDNQIYSAPWALRFNGEYDKEMYKYQDNARLVDKLEGKLLLVHGLLDDNVNPSQTFRLIEFLEKANKEYDLVLLPDTDHNCPANPYFLRIRFDYFVKHLMKEEPPHNYLFKNKFFNYDEIKK